MTAKRQRQGIIVCGCNGCGKSTLGRELARRLGFRFLDIEDYYFPKTDPDHPYRESRSWEEVTALLAADTAKERPFVLAAVKGKFGSEIESRFACAILLTVPGELRARRVRERSFGRFGERMLPGGDLHEAEEQFFRMAASKTPEEVAEWAAALSCPIIEIDSTGPVDEIIKIMLEKLPKDFLEE